MNVMFFRRLFLAGALSLVLSSRVLAQSYSLAASISGQSLTSEWTAFQANPNGYTSSYSFSAGEMTLNNREWLYLTNPLSASNPQLTVAGTFDLTQGGDFLTVALHTDANTTLGVGRGSTYSVDLYSLQVLFSTFGTDGVSINAVQGTESATTLAFVPYTFNNYQNYTFSIVDNGSTVNVSVNGSLLTSFNYISSPYYSPSGTNVLVYNRESLPGLELSSLTVNAVPEPSTLAQMSAGIAALIAFLGYRRAYKRAA